MLQHQTGNVCMDTGGSDSRVNHQPVEPSICRLLEKEVKAAGTGRMVSGTDPGFFPRGCRVNILRERCYAVKAFSGRSSLCIAEEQVDQMFGEDTPRHRVQPWNRVNNAESSQDALISLYADPRKSLKTPGISSDYHPAAVPEPYGCGEHVQRVDGLASAMKLPHHAGGGLPSLTIQRHHLQPLNQSLSLTPASLTITHPTPDPEKQLIHVDGCGGGAVKTLGDPHRPGVAPEQVDQETGVKKPQLGASQTR